METCIAGEIHVPTSCWVSASVRPLKPQRQWSVGQDRQQAVFQFRGKTPQRGLLERHCAFKSDGIVSLDVESDYVFGNGDDVSTVVE